MRTQFLLCVHEIFGRLEHPSQERKCTSLATWEQKDREPLERYASGEAHHLPCYLPGWEVKCCTHDWQSWAFYWTAFFFLNGASSCENLHSAHGSYASSLEPDLSCNAKSLIQADVCLGQEIWGSSIVIKLLLIWLPFFQNRNFCYSQKRARGCLHLLLLGKMLDF